MLRAVFLDRDDTLIACNSLPAPPPPAAPGDLVDPALVRLLPGVLRACEALKEAGYVLVVVSNQGCVARGGATLAMVRAVNDRLGDLLTTENGPLIDAVYFCPFHPKGVLPEFSREHPWRKPAPGMLLEAAEELNLDLAASWLVGDAQRDIDAGLAAGLAPAHCLRIGEDQPLPDLLAAAELILADSPLTTITLHAHAADALMREGVRAVASAAAYALAERYDLRLSVVEIDDTTLAASVFADEVTALGFAAELRRNTSAWYQAKYHAGPLWRTPEGD